ncbi:MAG: hypothetical protein EXQ87_08675 [Alphaproteobacteria bacterium]|nr:hypothetical protein [Alphaproteobacteria bacterium]
MSIAEAGEDRAIQDPDRGIRLGPGDAHTFINRAIAYGRKGEYGRAVQDYDFAIHIEPDSAQAFQYRALASQRAGDRAAAVKDFAKARNLATAEEWARIERDLGRFRLP